MIVIAGRPIGQSHRSYVIAEVGINARSDLELAKAHIREAAKAGADAVKFQTHFADEEMVQSEMNQIGAENVYQTVSKNEWSLEQHQILNDYCTEQNVDFLSTPFSTAAVSLLEEIDVPAIKIGSGELSNRELLDCVVRTGKPLIVSTGMAGQETIKQANEFLRSRTDDVVYLHCVSAYPTEPEDLHLCTIEELRTRLDADIGFSDHSTGIKAAILSLQHSPCIIEKHFTIDRSLPGPDQDVSIEPAELKELVQYLDYAERARGSKESITEEEKEIKQWANHSLVTSRFVSAGDRFTESNLTTKRPGTGISAEAYFDIIGETAAVDISSNTMLSTEDIQ